MPDLLQLRSLAKKQPELYEQEVQQQYSTYQALVELYKIQQGQKYENLVQIVEFLTQLVPYYKDMLKDFPQTLLQLIDETNDQIDSSFRLTILSHVKQLFSKKILKLNQTNIQQLISMLCIHDKALRQSVQQLLLQQLPLQIKEEQIITQIISICLSEQSPLLGKTKIMEVLHELFYSGKLVNSGTDYKVAQLFEQLLCRSPDRRVIILSLNFFLAQQAQNEAEDEEEDSDAIVTGNEDITVAEAVHNDEIKKQMNQLQKISKVYRLDETKRRREIEKIQNKIRKLRFKGQTTTNNVPNVIDLINDHYELIDKLEHKFIQGSCQFQIRLRVFELISIIIEQQDLQTPGIFAQFCRFVRPSQENVTLILLYLIKAVNQNQDIDEIRQTINHIYFNFIHSGSTDDEMVVGLNTITNICKKRPECLLQDDDGINLLNQLVTLTSDKETKRSRAQTQSHTKTSNATRKGVVMAARALLQFYRIVAPGYLDKKFLNQESRQLLSNLKMMGDKEAIADINKTQSQFRIPGIHILEQQDDYSEYSDDSQESNQMSEQERKLQLNLRQKLESILSQVRIDKKILEDSTIENIKKAFKVTVDKYGNILDAPSYMFGPIRGECDTMSDQEQLSYFDYDEYDSEIMSEMVEEFNEDEDNKIQITTNSDSDEEKLLNSELFEDLYEDDYEYDTDNYEHEGQNDKMPNIQQYQEEISEGEDQENKETEFKFDDTVPLEQQCILTQKQLMKLKKYRQELKVANAIDLEQYIQRKKMTSEEKRQHTSESKQPNGHKSNYWDRKDITKKSRTNKEKLNLKPIAMTIHSQQVKKRLGRTRKEKERVRRQHAYNSKRGISKKINK